MKKQIMLMAGPTTIPEEELRAMGRQIIFHRSEEFEKITAEVGENLKKVFRTSQPVMTLTGSGTSAMEAAVENCFSPGDEVVAVVLGVFSKRMADMAEAFGLKVIRVEKQPGEAASVQEVLSVMTPRTKGVFVIHNESATGVTSDLKAFGEALKDTQALLITDTVSGLGALDFRMDEWHIDVAFAGSQKALMGAPGLAFIALSEKAWKASEQAKLPRFYFDLALARKFAERGQTPWTPAIYQILGIQASLRMMMDEGMDQIVARTDRFAAMLTEGLAEIGLYPFAKDPARASKSVVTIAYDKAPQFVARLKEEYGITVYGGQAELFGSTFRIGNMGYVSETDIAAFLYAAKKVYKELEG